MATGRGKGSFSFTYLFASFFGAAMIAATFAYYNYKFSQYRFIDFNKVVLYTPSDIFQPKAPEYIVVVYSAHAQVPMVAMKRLGSKKPVLAIDLYQTRRPAEGNVTFVSAGTKTLLQLIHRFHIQEVPSYFMIKRQNNKGLYKQESQIYRLEEQ